MKRANSDIRRSLPRIVLLTSVSLALCAIPALALGRVPHIPSAPVPSTPVEPVDEAPIIEPPAPPAPSGTAQPAGTGASGSGAGAGATIRVHALVAERFSLTIRTSGDLDFGEVRVGRHYSLSRIPIMQVRSNRPWVLTDSSDRMIQNLAGRDWERDRILQHSPRPSFNRILSPGSYEVDCDYTLNLSDPGLRVLPKDTVIETDMGYTIIQP